MMTHRHWQVDTDLPATLACKTKTHYVKQSLKYAKQSQQAWQSLDHRSYSAPLPLHRMSIKQSPKLLTRLGASISLGLIVLTQASVAQAASCQIPKSYYKHVSCTADSRYYLAVKDFGAPVALLDNKGKKVADLMDYQRVDASKIAGGLMPVQRNSRVGYVDMRGREVIPTRYDLLGSNSSWARAVSEGRIIVKRNGEYGVITTKNQIVLPFDAIYSSIDNYEDGIARLVTKKGTRYIDKNGNIVPSPDRSSGTSLSSETASDSVPPVSNPSKRPQLATPFTTLTPQQQDGKWGFIDEDGVVMITYSFDEVRPFSEGLAAVRIDDHWGFVNLGGQLVIPFHFDPEVSEVAGQYHDDSALVFKDGKAWVGVLTNGEKTCIDKRADIVDCESP